MTTLPLLAKHVLIDPPVTDAGAVLRALAGMLAISTGRSVVDVVLALENREVQGSTGIGHGVALPHARIEGATEVAIAALRSPQGIPFAAPDALNVRIFIAVAVPKHAATAHLEILSALAARLASDVVRADLLQAQSAEDFFQLLTHSD